MINSDVLTDKKKAKIRETGIVSPCNFGGQNVTYAAFLFLPLPLD